MNLLYQIAFIARVELRIFWQSPKLLLAALVVAIMPALYTLIYLSSVWDPAGHVGALPVALVNLDQGVTYRDQRFNVGNEVVQSLRAKHSFGFVSFDSDTQARKAVREGTMAFALIFPSDLSSNAVPGAHPGAGKLIIFTSAGNNFESALIAKQFATELGHDVNESLNEQRWALMLRSAAGSERNVQLLRDGVNQLRSGADELMVGTAQSAGGASKLAAGAGRLHSGLEDFTSGFKSLASGVRAMDASRPHPADLTQLKNGADALAAGHAELGSGLAELQEGSKKMLDGVSTFRAQARDSFLTPTRVNDGLDQLLGGATLLDKGLLSASAAQQKLQVGATALSVGVGTLTSGMRSMGAGIHSAANRLPQDSALDELNRGADAVQAGAKALASATGRVHSGVARLSAGLDLLASSLPRAPTMEGSAQGLANSVQPEVEVTAAVANSGAGFAPNVIPAALWLGAGIAAFLIHVRVLPRHAQFFPRHAQLLGKIVLPAGVVMLQTLFVWGTVLLVLGIQVVHPGAFALCLVVAAFTFLCIVMALTRALGDAGKALAMILLIVQLSSSGGVLPVELSGGMFASISPWLPLTWVVRALKAAMFGAYEGAWPFPVAIVLLAGLLAGACACWVGRWRFVRVTSIRPAVDF